MSVTAESECVPHLPTNDTDPFMKAAEEVMTSMGIPILRIYKASVTEWEYHVGTQRRSDEKHLVDCTHFCQPSDVLHQWVQAFFNVLI